MNILQDIKTAVDVSGTIQIRPDRSIPLVIPKSAYINTIEGCLAWKLGRDTDMAVKSVFKGLPYETQRRLEFTPKKSGEWMERARFWQRELAPALPPRMYHDVMMLFIGWYTHCLRIRPLTVAQSAVRSEHFTQTVPRAAEPPHCLG